MKSEWKGISIQVPLPHQQSYRREEFTEKPASSVHTQEIKDEKKRNEKADFLTRRWHKKEKKPKYDDANDDDDRIGSRSRKEMRKRHEKNSL
jgi:hypothetical protein